MKPSQADRSQDRHPGSATTEELRNGAADADFRSKAAQGPCGQLGSNSGGSDSWIRAQVLVSVSHIYILIYTIYLIDKQHTYTDYALSRKSATVIQSWGWKTLALATTSLQVLYKHTRSHDAAKVAKYHM